MRYIHAIYLPFNSECEVRTSDFDQFRFNTSCTSESMNVTYSEAAYFNDVPGNECYVNATDAPFTVGQNLTSVGKCSFTVRVKVGNGTYDNYTTSCTQFSVLSNVWDHGKYLTVSAALILALASL